MRDDCVLHNKDVSGPFIYLHIGRVRSGEEEDGARTPDLSQSDTSTRAGSHLPGDSLVSTPQSGARLHKHTPSTSQQTRQRAKKLHCFACFLCFISEIAV